MSSAPSSAHGSQTKPLTCDPSARARVPIASGGGTSATNPDGDHDVEEAVYLSGRVYVLTSHPGHVAAEVPVPLPADRGPGVKRDELFLDLRDHIQEILVDQVRA